jgi:hypothetical protein
MFDKEEEAPVDPLMEPVKRPKYITPEEARRAFGGELSGKTARRSSTVRSIRVFEAYKSYYD